MRHLTSQNLYYIPTSYSRRDIPVNGEQSGAPLLNLPQRVIEPEYERVIAYLPHFNSLAISVRTRANVWV